MSLAVRGPVCAASGVQEPEEGGPAVSSSVDDEEAASAGTVRTAARTRAMSRAGVLRIISEAG
jgi:hypothetical protein